MSRERVQDLLQNIPQCLRQRDQWVVWRQIERGGKPTKCPVNARTGESASTTDASTWSSFQAAVAACQAQPRYEGIGFVFSATDPCCGIDLDDCIDAGGTLKPWAERIIRLVNTYSETSPSGRGVKLFLQAAKPGPRCRIPLEDGQIEIYDRDRFFTVTGRHLEHTSAQVEMRQGQLEELYQQIFQEDRPPTPPPKPIPDPPNSSLENSLTDEQIIEKASQSVHGEKFKALWAGQWSGWFGSQSEADSSLVFSLVFFTRDAIQIDRLFRRSGLMRPKWDRQRGAQGDQILTPFRPVTAAGVGLAHCQVLV